jgi:ATP-dependent DNA ligase
LLSKRLGSPYRSGRSVHWVKIKNPKAPAVKREAEEDWLAAKVNASLMNVKLKGKREAEHAYDA